MARLYDRVRIQAKLPDGTGAQWAEDARFWRAAIANCEAVFVIDDVSEYVRSHGMPDVAGLRVGLPFSTFWMEHRMPRAAFGACFNLIDRGPSTAVRWSGTAAVYVGTSRRHPIVGPVFQVRLRVGGDGAVVVDDYRARVFSAPNTRADARATHGTFGPFMMALGLLACRNVHRREVEQPEKLSKKWAKKHGRPLVRYHVLDIDPMRKVLKSEGRSDEVGLKKALHICRGHFATYTEDAPLFGRVTGTFWKPQHVRGSAKQGVVVKDYNVKAPPK
jgi:hypothetical protein